MLPQVFLCLSNQTLIWSSWVEAIICHVNYTQTKCSWTFLATFLKLRKTHPQPGGSYEDEVESKKANLKYKDSKEPHSLYFSLFNH